MSLILGIESSCDETAAALVTSDRRILAHRLAGQEEAHRPFGGVVPEIAARAHVEILPGLIEEVLAEAEDQTGRSRRDRRDRRAGPDRWRHGGAADRQGAGACLRQAADRAQPSRGARALADAERSRSRLSLSAAARLGRPLPIALRRGGRPLSPPRHHDRRRRRRSLRQEREAARPWFPGRPGGREGGGGGRSAARCRCRARCSARTSRISPSPA